MSIPKTMQAVLTIGHGGLEKLDVRDDVLVPKPGPGEVLVEVSGCGMNNTDIWVRQGAYGTDDDPNAVASWRRGQLENTLTFPRIQGADTAGRIAAVGAGVDAARIGERVIVDFSIYNGDGVSLADIDYIGHGRDGGYAEYMVAPAENVYEVKRPISDAELATFCCAYLTAEHMLDRAGVEAGERVLITGASGGVGSGLIQLCRARGAIPYALAGQGKENAVKAIGAEAVITRGEGPLGEAVHRATGGRPIDVVADLVAGPLFGDLINLIRPEGRYTTAGAIAGPLVTLDLRTLYLKHLTLHGSSQGTRAAFQRLVRYIEDGRIKPLLWKTYPLSKIREAQADFMAKGFVGKLVVVPDRKWKE
ncbi:MAG: alcohol dehydrogenase family protein [Hyphomicrobiaceae bacterium]